MLEWINLRGDRWSLNVPHGEYLVTPRWWWIFIPSNNKDVVKKLKNYKSCKSIEDGKLACEEHYQEFCKLGSHTDHGI